MPAAQSIVLSIPNLLTYGRIAAVPAIVACLYSSAPVWLWTAVVIFIIAAVTDFFDGYLARVLDQQSSLGKMLDPIADKLLVGAVLMMLAANGTIAGWSLVPAIIILSREILVSGLREYLGQMSLSVPVSKLAKWKTTVQLVALGVLIAGPAGDALIPFASEAGLTLLWLAAALTVWTGYDYVRAGIAHL
ncbi:MAG: CDP-diacylglycerol--glycerol-3-phosphate 3-phosphatidyltransferase, partial [Devosiaceae bacterium]|nr:CDP-diacylglycerol--glycerol-3-phosphate 3-phosphatidyltransferase [Devosiaceae bacterium MH13]